MLLRYDNGENKGKEIVIPEKGLVIGRYNGCDLQIDEDGISRKHCQIKIINDSVIIEDLQSTNGVKVNGSKIDSKQVLEPEDKLEIGKYRFLCIAESVDVKEEENNSGGFKTVLGIIYTGDLIIIFLGLIYFIIYLLKNKPVIVG